MVLQNPGAATFLTSEILQAICLPSKRHIGLFKRSYVPNASVLTKSARGGGRYFSEKTCSKDHAKSPSDFAKSTCQPPLDSVRLGGEVRLIGGNLPANQFCT